MRYIYREKYLKEIEGFLDKPVVKIISGMRRVGKSVLVKIIMERLKKKGLKKENLIYVNKESLEFEEIKNYLDLYRYVKDYFGSVKGNKYIFIDEIQEIAGWEKAVNSLLSENLGDIIITGSNAKLLSSDISALLSGRYVALNVYPLSFSEFLKFRKNSGDLEGEFKNYLKYGGLPGIHNLSFEEENVFKYLSSMVESILYKDVILRHKIRDIESFDRIVRYVFDNIGNVTTAKRISDYFKSQKIKISVDTVVNYLKFIEASFLISKASRYDIKGRRILEFYEKFFINDIGMRHGFIGYREGDINGLLENIVYNELKFRGYKVSIGMFSGLEIDFVAEKQGEVKYFQVAYLLNGKAVVEREFGNLLKIKDNYEKNVISMDKFFPREKEGVKHKYLIDFLSETENIW